MNEDYFQHWAEVIEQDHQAELPADEATCTIVEIRGADCLYELDSNSGTWRGWFRDGESIKDIRWQDVAMGDMPITLTEAAELFPLAYSTLAQAAREGRFQARQSGATWLTTREAIEAAIQAGKLRPRARDDNGAS